MAAMDRVPTVTIYPRSGTVDIMASRLGVSIIMTLTRDQAYQLADALVTEARKLPVEAVAADFTTEGRAP